MEKYFSQMSLVQMVNIITGMHRLKVILNETKTVTIFKITMSSVILAYT